MPMSARWRFHPIQRWSYLTWPAFSNNPTYNPATGIPLSRHPALNVLLLPPSTIRWAEYVFREFSRIFSRSSNSQSWYPVTPFPLHTLPSFQINVADLPSPPQVPPSRAGDVWSRVDQFNKWTSLSKTLATDSYLDVSALCSCILRFNKLNNCLVFTGF